MLSASPQLTELIRQASLIIWDSAPMVQQNNVLALNRSIEDLLQSSPNFGGKSVLLAGDYP